MLAAIKWWKIYWPEIVAELLINCTNMAQKEPLSSRFPFALHVQSGWKVLIVFFVRPFYVAFRFQVIIGIVDVQCSMLMTAIVIFVFFHTFSSFWAHF